jgi:hypothetical protein
MRSDVIKALARAAIACLALGAAVPTAVLAQEAIPTAPSAPGYGAPGDGAPSAPESGPLRLSDRIDEGPDVLRPMGPCGGPARKEDGKPDRSPHGEVWAGIGSHGYRDIGGVVCAPLGDNAALSIAVDAGQINGWRGRR